MYEDYYLFRRQPFSPTPDPEFLYRSDSHQEALEQLLRGVRRREGMLLLSGDVGTGKTTTTRALLQLLDRDVFTALVLNPFVTADELLRVLLQDFGVVSDVRALQDASRQSLIETLNRFLLSLSTVGASALAVVDEAQNLPAETLEQLRVLTALETDRQKLLQILLVGQPELLTVLGTAEMRPLNQRIARRCELRPLNRDEVEKYVGFRIRMARGAWETMFNPRAIDLVYQLSEGVPRKINLICDRSLEAGYAGLKPTIDETIVAKAAEALELGASLPSLGRVSRSSTRSHGRLGSQTRRMMAAAAGVIAGVGLGAMLTLYGPEVLSGRPVGSGPPPQLAAIELPQPIDLSTATEATLDETYVLRTGVFETTEAAEASAEMLRELGAPAILAPVTLEDGTMGPAIWIGPYASEADAEQLRVIVTDRFGFSDVEVVAGLLPDAT